MNQININQAKLTAFALFFALLGSSSLQAANAERTHATMSINDACAILRVNPADYQKFDEKTFKSNATKAFHKLSKTDAPDKKQAAFVRDLEQKNPAKKNLIALAKYQDEDTLAQEIRRRQQKKETQLSDADLAFIESTRQLIKAEVFSATEKFKSIVSASERLVNDYSLLDPGAFAPQPANAQPLSFADQQLEQAWLAQNLDEFQLALDQGANPDAKFPSQNNKPLLKTAIESLLKKGQDETEEQKLQRHLSWKPWIDALSNAGADLEFSLDDGKTTLITALDTGNGALLSLLLMGKNKANVEGLITDDSGHHSMGKVTPLIYAINKTAGQEKYQYLMHMLINHVNPNTPDDSGRTPLMHASGKGDLAMVQKLLTAKADVNRQGPQDNTALLSLALQKEVHPHRLAIVEALLDAKADVNIKNRDGDDFTAVVELENDSRLADIDALLTQRAQQKAQQAARLAAEEEEKERARQADEEIKKRRAESREKFTKTHAQAYKAAQTEAAKPEVREQQERQEKAQQQAEQLKKVEQHEKAINHQRQAQKAEENQKAAERQAQIEAEQQARVEQGEKQRAEGIEKANQKAYAEEKQKLEALQQAEQTQKSFEAHQKSELQAKAQQQKQVEQQEKQQVAAEQREKQILAAQQQKHAERQSKANFQARWQRDREQQEKEATEQREKQAHAERQAKQQAQAEQQHKQHAEQQLKAQQHAELRHKQHVAAEQRGKQAHAEQQQKAHQQAAQQHKKAEQHEKAVSKQVTFMQHLQQLEEDHTYVPGRPALNQSQWDPKQHNAILTFLTLNDLDGAIGAIEHNNIDWTAKDPKTGKSLRKMIQEAIQENKKLVLKNKTATRKAIFYGITQENTSLEKANKFMRCLLKGSNRLACQNVGQLLKEKDEAAIKQLLEELHAGNLQKAEATARGARRNWGIWGNDFTPEDLQTPEYQQTLYDIAQKCNVLTTPYDPNALHQQVQQRVAQEEKDAEFERNRVLNKFGDA